MVADITDDDFTAHSLDPYAEEEAALAAAQAQAVETLNRLREKASIDDQLKGNNPDYSLHEAKGFGQYVIPRRTGWQALLKIIHDPVPNIDFSPKIYPTFDGIVGEHFPSPYLIEPDNMDVDLLNRNKFDQYEDLRDNIAAVRNFLLQTYYANTPEGMSPEKAEEALKEIAAFVGDGLYNNWLWLGIFPHHYRNQPHIDLNRAREGGGKGAQYIYEKILEQQRHSGWLRPFEKLTELFGGKVHHDWKLPPGSETHFRDFIIKDVADINGTRSAQEAAAIAIANAQNRAAEIEARLNAIRDAKSVSTTALDLDAIGNHLLFTAQHLDQGVAHLSEPVRRDAVEIAKDILNKLKVAIGDTLALAGLTMKPSDDMATLGAVRGVAMVYERLLAWARSNNDTAIFQHPAVLAATQAIGQLGTIAKIEALGMAELAKNGPLASSLREQIKRIPEAFKISEGTKIGDLLNAVESGITTIINRTQQVSVTGAKVEFNRENTLGTSMSAAPIAGMAAQAAGEDASRRNAAALQAEQFAEQLRAQKMNAQLAASARAQQQATGNTPQQATQAAAPRSQSTVGRASASRTAQQASRASTVATNTTSSATPQVNLTPQQQAMAQRTANAAALAQAERERSEKAARDQALLAQQQANATMMKAAAKARETVARMDPQTLQGLKSATNLQGVTGAPVAVGKAALDAKVKAAIQNRIQSSTAAVVEQKPLAALPPGPLPDDKNRYPLPPGTPPRPGTNGRGI